MIKHLPRFSSGLFLRAQQRLDQRGKVARAVVYTWDPANLTNAYKGGPIHAVDKIAEVMSAAAPTRAGPHLEPFCILVGSPAGGYHPDLPLGLASPIVGPVQSLGLNEVDAVINSLRLKLHKMELACTQAGPLIVMYAPHAQTTASRVRISLHATSVLFGFQTCATAIPPPFARV